MRHCRHFRLEWGGPRTCHPPCKAPAHLTGALSPTQGSSLFPMGFSRSLTFRRVTQAPTAAWPPTQPASASARRLYSVWPAEVRGLAGQEMGCYGLRHLRAGRGLKRSKPCLQIGDRVSLPSGEVMQPRDGRATQQIRSRAGLPVQGSLPMEACSLGWMAQPGWGQRWGGI